MGLSSHMEELDSLDFDKRGFERLTTSTFQRAVIALQSLEPSRCSRDKGKHFSTRGRAPAPAARPADR